MSKFILSKKKFTLISMDVVEQNGYYLYGFQSYGDIWFAIDGIIFNQDELLKEMCATTLSEAIVLGYKKWGSKLASHMRGAFSFVLINNDSIYFAKDQLGLRPLYYGDQSSFFCGSDLITLLDAKLFEPIVNREGLTQMFAIGPAMDEHQSLYRDVKMLAMGEYGLYDRKKELLSTHVYYDLCSKPHIDDFNQTIHHVHELVENSILEQLSFASGSLLSGGLDSSIICAVASKKENFHTYALDYEGNKDYFVGNQFQVSLDDSFIQKMVDQFHLQHKLYTISQETLCDYVEDACLKRGFPGMADVDGSMLWLFQQMKQDGTEVFFSGECSDEAFCGYPWEYQEELQYDGFPWTRYSASRLELLHSDLKDLPIQEYSQKRYEETIKKVKRLPNDTEEDYRARKHTMLVTHWFMQTLLLRQVTMSSGANVMVLAPFADYRIFDYAYNIPWIMKYANQEEKGILRMAFEQQLPDAITHRKKNPYPKTHHPAYKQLIVNKLKEAYQDSNSVLHELFDQKALLKLIESAGESYENPWYGQLMSGPQLLAYLYQIHVWAKHFHVRIEK